MKTAKKTINELTSNQYYKGLNNRFDNRVKKLFKLGYKYSHERVGFIVPGMSSRGLLHNSFVMHADRRAFNRETIYTFN